MAVKEGEGTREEARRKDKSPSPRRKSDRQAWEDMDFITALTDPDVEREAPEER